MGAGTGDKVNPQEEDEENGEIDDSESQVSLSRTHKNKAPMNIEKCYSDRFDAVRTISKTIDGMNTTVKRVHDNEKLGYAIRSN